MHSPLLSTGLQVALAVIMFGLGLSLTTRDFARIARDPKTVGITLACQLVLLPVAAFGLVLLFGLPPVLAVGMMVLAASPGGTTANAVEQRGQRQMPGGVLVIGHRLAFRHVPGGDRIARDRRTEMNDLRLW